MEGDKGIKDGRGEGNLRGKSKATGGTGDKATADESSGTANRTGVRIEWRRVVGSRGRSAGSARAQGGSKGFETPVTPPRAEKETLGK